MTSYRYRCAETTASAAGRQSFDARPTTTNRQASHDESRQCQYLRFSEAKERVPHLVSARYSTIDRPRQYYALFIGDINRGLHDVSFYASIFTYCLHNAKCPRNMNKCRRYFIFPHDYYIKTMIR